MAMLERIYDCLTCKAHIKLEKRAEGGWNKFNLDGSQHVHPRKNNQQQQQTQQIVSTPTTKSELEDLQKEVADVKTLVKTLITQVQLARQELGELKKKK